MKLIYLRCIHCKIGRFHDDHGKQYKCSDCITDDKKEKNKKEKDKKEKNKKEKDKYIRRIPGYIVKVKYEKRIDNRNKSTDIIYYPFVETNDSIMLTYEGYLENEDMYNMDTPKNEGETISILNAKLIKDISDRNVC